jgi:hypothetical protein
MAELKRIEEEFPAPEPARYGNPSKQPEGLKMVKGQEPGTLDRGTAVSEPPAIVFWTGDRRFPIAVEQDTDWLRRRAAPNGRRCRQACS